MRDQRFNEINKKISKIIDFSSKRVHKMNVNTFEFESIIKVKLFKM